MKAITTRYHGPTNTKAARIIASDMDGNNFQLSVSEVDSLNEADQHHVAAKRLSEKMKWEGRLAGGYVKGGLVWVFVD